MWIDYKEMFCEWHWRATCVSHTSHSLHFLSFFRSYSNNSYKIFPSILYISLFKFELKAPDEPLKNSKKNMNDSAFNRFACDICVQWQYSREHFAIKQHQYLTCIFRPILLTVSKPEVISVIAIGEPSTSVYIETAYHRL